ncbi:MAG: RidA family protein [Candidatus Theseobacter exili]|nr:RidA family protein [Candidatus Theseobacter exili]
MKRIIRTDLAPAAIGPYSQAVEAGGFLFVSGQIPIDPMSGELETGSIEKQTERVINNITGILNSANMSIDNVVKTTLYLADINNFIKVNNIYSQIFKTSLPARACIEAAALPKGVGVEMDVIAYRG